jgi:uncharacterized repeat protein (TIGR03803 family)
MRHAALFANGLRSGHGGNAVLYSFNGPDGAYPSSALLRDSRGNLYGTTVERDGSNNCQSGCGNSSNWIRRASSPCCTGNLYGTTGGGGKSNLATIYEISKSGKESVLHSFKGIPDRQTSQDLFLAPDDTLFGAEYLDGGSCSAEGQYGCGTMLSLTKGQVRILHRFQRMDDGICPLGPVPAAFSTVQLS